jgi:hypothetical protein
MVGTERVGLVHLEETDEDVEIIGIEELLGPGDMVSSVKPRDAGEGPRDLSH